MMVSQEPEWHRMIAEAAYYLAQKRGFRGEHSLEDWLAAEQQVRQVISPILNSEVSMTDNPSKPVSVDDGIDAIAREALEEARRAEEAERYRQTPGPVVPPQKSAIVP
jgi:Protein of unknown function (DUF2934)